MTWQRALSTEQEVALIREYEAEGWTINDLSVIYRISVRTVYRIFAKYAVPTPTQTGRRYLKAPKERQLKPCGTNAAYQRHRRKGEYPCTDCLAAHSLNVANAKKRSST